MQVIRKPEVLEAIQWTKHGDCPQVDQYVSPNCPTTARCNDCGAYLTDHGHLFTWDGRDCKICPGDWILIDQECYNTCKKDLFEALYVPVQPKITV